MKPAVRYGLFAAAAYGVFLIATLPAALITEHFADRLPIHLQGATGSVWSGQAAAAVVKGRELRQPVWRLQPSRLLAGRVQYEMGFDNGASHAIGVIGRGLGGDLLLRDIDATFVASEFAPLFNAQALGLNGAIDANLERVDIQNGAVAFASGTLMWKQAGVQSPRPVQLGDLHAVLETVDDGVKATVTDQGGPLLVDGVLLLVPDGTYRVTGTVAARNAGDATLLQALRMMGAPGPDGKINVAFNGKLPPLGAN